MPRPDTGESDGRGPRRGRAVLPAAAPTAYGEPVDLGLGGRVALVVGGTGYIGTAVADRLRREGATVLTASRSGGDLRIDAADPASVEAGLTEVIRAHGRVDVLVVAVVDEPSPEVAPARGGESSPAQIAFLASDAAAAVSGESISTGHKVCGIATT